MPESPLGSLARRVFGVRRREVRGIPILPLLVWWSVHRVRGALLLIHSSKRDRRECPAVANAVVSAPRDHARQRASSTIHQRVVCNPTPRESIRPAAVACIVTSAVRAQSALRLLGMNSILSAPLYSVFIVPVYACSPSHSSWPQDGADDRHHHRHGAGRPEGRRSPAGAGDGEGWGPTQAPGNRAHGEEHGAVTGGV